jgi:hypothetical protein
MAVFVRGIRRSLTGDSENHEASSTVCVVVSQDSRFRERKYVTGKPGGFPIQKVVSAFRQLCRSLSSDGVEEYAGLNESTSNEA